MRYWFGLICLAMALCAPARLAAQSAESLYRAVSARASKPIATISYGADFAEPMRPYAAARVSGDPVDVLEPAKANHVDIVTPGSVNGDAAIAFIAAKALLPAVPPAR